MEHDTNTIKEKVHQYVLQQTFADKEKIQYDTLLFREGYFDSMGFIMLITFIEDEFSIKIPNPYPQTALSKQLDMIILLEPLATVIAPFP